MRALTLILVLLLVAAVWWSNSPTLAPAVPSVVPAAAPTDAPTDAPVRVDVATREPAPETGGVLVRVVDAATGSPVPAALVSWCGKGLGKPPQVAEEYTARTIDAEAFHRERGLHGVTDARGEVRVPADGWLAVAARAGERYGEAVSQGRATELVVAVHADTALAIRTVDAAGRPVAGVAVRLTCTWAEPVSKPVAWRALLPASDERGMTALPHVQELVSPRIAERLPQFRFTNAVQWRSATLVACLTSGDGPPTTVDLQHLPLQPIDVAVPGIGSLEFVLRGPDGAPFPLQTDPHLRAVLVPKGGMSQPIEPGILTQPWRADGRALFAQVTLGERLELLGRTDWYAGMKFDGPTRPGEHLVVDVNMSAELVWITGRLFAEDGTPWTRDALLRLGGVYDILPGNAAGRFCLPVPEHVLSKPRAFVASDDGAVEAEMVLPAPLAAGANDLGVVVLKRPPLLVSGQVVVPDDEHGAAVRKTLRAHIESWPPDAMMGRADRLQVELDAEGRFAVHALARNIRYEFFVDGNVARGGYRKFDPGTTGLVLDVSPGGRIEASFLVDPAWGTLAIAFVRADAPPAEAHSTSFVQCASGRVAAHADSLEAGQYHVVASKDAVVLADLLVAVTAGKLADDPRLRDFDLRNRSQSVRVVATDEAGAAIDAETHVAWRPAGAGDDRWAVQRYTHDAGRGTTILAGDAIDVCVWAVGHRAVDQAAVRDTATLVLPRLPQVTLRWVEAPELPPGVTAHLVWERPDDEPAAAAAGPRRGASLVREARRGGPLPELLAGGEAKCCAVPGERLRARLQLRAPFKKSAVIELAPAELHTATFIAGQAIELRADPETVRTALQKLAGK